MAGSGGGWHVNGQAAAGLHLQASAAPTAHFCWLSGSMVACLHMLAVSGAEWWAEQGANLHPHMPRLDSLRLHPYLCNPRVRVTNERSNTIQVLGRSWEIVDANGELGERCSTFAPDSTTPQLYPKRRLTQQPRPLPVINHDPEPRPLDLRPTHTLPVGHVPLSPENAIVGQQPVIPSGRTFEYVSGSMIATPSGGMRGSLAVAELRGARPWKRGDEW